MDLHFLTFKLRRVPSLSLPEHIPSLLDKEEELWLFPRLMWPQQKKELHIANKADSASVHYSPDVLAEGVLERTAHPGVRFLVPSRFYVGFS